MDKAYVCFLYFALFQQSLLGILLLMPRSQEHAVEQYTRDNAQNEKDTDNYDPFSFFSYEFHEIKSLLAGTIAGTLIANALAFSRIRTGSFQHSVS